MENVCTLYDCQGETGTFKFDKKCLMVGNVEFLIGKTNGCSLWFVDCLASDEAALGFPFKQDVREKI